MPLNYSQDSKLLTGKLKIYKSIAEIARDFIHLDYPI